MKKIENINIHIEQAKKEPYHTMYFENELKKQYVLSKYTPKVDAIQRLGNERGNKQTVWIILGFALGYTVRELLDNVSEEITIIVIEPNEELLNYQMQYEQNMELKEKDNIHFLYGEINGEFREKLSNYIPTKEINNIKIICMSTYLEFYFEYFEQIKTVIQHTLCFRVIDMNTIRKYNKLFTSNVIKNRYAIEKSYRLDKLRGICQGIPALIVSAGPSLQKNIQYIKDFKGIILVGNRTLAPVLEQGVKPDFMVVADPKDAVFDTTRGTMQADIPLISNDNANNKLVEEHQGKKYFIQTNANSQELLGVEGIAKVSMGGSVATLCASVAQYIGCDPIVLIGQDCAYTDMKIHASNCSNDLLGKKSNDSSTIKTSKIWIDEYYGGKILSSMDLVSFLSWFEEFIQRSPNLTVINATEGGALIKGAINRPFKEVVEEYKDIVVPNFEKYDQRVECKVPVDERLNMLTGILKDIMKEAKKAQGLSEQLKAEYKVYKGMRLGKIASLVRKLDKLDAKIKEQGETKNVVKMIFSSLENDAKTSLTNKAKIGESEIEAGIRIAIESYNLYSNITEACKVFIDIIEQDQDNQ